MPQYYTQAHKNDPNDSFDFHSSSTPQGVIVYLGTNDYCAGSSPELDANFTAGFLSLMDKITQVYYGSPASPANITFFALLGPMSPTLPSAALQAAVSRGTANGHRIFLVLSAVMI